MITDKEIEWREPPRLERNWQELLEQLKAHPSKWAKVATQSSVDGAKSAVYKLKNGMLSTPEGVYEFASSGKDVFARYLGEDEAGKVKGALLPAPTFLELCTKSIPHWSAA